MTALLQRALDALIESFDDVQHGYALQKENYGRIPSRTNQLEEHKKLVDAHQAAINDLQAATAAASEVPPLGYIDRKDIARLSNYKATIWPGRTEIDAVAVYLAVPQPLGAALTDDEIGRAADAYKQENPNETQKTFFWAGALWATQRTKRAKQ